ncbi:MAG: autoinducer binding domain-containing protein [Aquabacterium sp.]|nr:autoinducer binding domain-containing protein [Aquabacterium sp.]
MILSSQTILQDALGNGGLTAALGHLTQVAQDLGFPFFAYGVKCPLPVSQPRIEMASNYPEIWQQQYQSHQYARIDPTVRHCTRVTTPVLWDASGFDERPFAEQAMSHGIRNGVSIGVRDAQGRLGMVTLARDQTVCTPKEFAHIEGSLTLLGQLTHAALVEKLVQRHSTSVAPPTLSDRELEVLKWTAEGKTSAEVAMIMNITERTVNFHIGNCITKLDASNKLHAAVKAAVSGLLG